MLTTCITISNHHNYHFRKLSEHQRNHKEKKTSRNLRNLVGGALECRSSSYFISPHDNWIIDTRASPHQVKVLKSWLSPSSERDFFPPLSALAMINGETERLWKATWRGFRSRKWFSIAEAVWWNISRIGLAWTSRGESFFGMIWDLLDLRSWIWGKLFGDMLTEVSSSFWNGC